jgi:hypothetical protein
MPRDVSKYHVDGVPVPSVTECLDQAGFVDLTKIPFQVLEDARLRGTAVHTWLELIVKTPDAVRGLDPPEFLAGYIAAWERWRVESRFEIESAEGSVVDHVYRYAGTFDVLGRMKQRAGLVDYKARYGLTAEVGPQTAGYLGAARDAARRGDIALDAGEPVDRYALLLRRDGTYRFEQQTSRADVHAFRAAVAVTHWQLEHRLTSLAAIRGRP